MSASELSETLRTHITDIFKSQEVSIGSSVGTRAMLAESVLTTDRFRSRFESLDSGHRAYVTHKGLSSLLKGIEEYSVDKVTSEVLQKIFYQEEKFYNGFISFLDNKRVGKSRLKDIPGAINPIISDDYEELGTEINIAQADQKKFFIEYFTTVVSKHIDNILVGKVAEAKKKAKVREIVSFVDSHINAGHLAGLLSSKAALAFGGRVSNIGPLYRDIEVKFDTEGEFSELESQVASAIKLLLDADYLSSSIVGNHHLMVTATKEALGTSPRFTTELQFSKDNQDAGKILGSVGTKLNELIRIFSGVRTKQHNLTINDAYRGFISSLLPVKNLVEDLAKKYKKDAKGQDVDLYKSILSNSKTIGTLIESPGSISIKNGIIANINNIIKTGKVLNKVTTRVSIKSSKPDPLNSVGLGLSKLFKDTSKALAKAQKDVNAKSALTKKPVVLKTTSRPKVVSQSILPTLQVLLDANLTEQIKQNMKKPALQNRTGRFAESVKVEKLSESRAGMISIFYNYMKNPYATFSKGGKQFSTSREPKTLISKSIREIASQLVGNRLRSISI